MKIEKLLIDQKAFLRWVQYRTGNVYRLLEVYLQRRSKTHVAVGLDWLAYTPKHKWDGVSWDGSENHPNWFKRWVKACASGKYSTHYDGAARKWWRVWRSRETVEFTDHCSWAKQLLSRMRRAWVSRFRKEQYNECRRLGQELLASQDDPTREAAPA